MRGREPTEEASEMEHLERPVTRKGFLAAGAAGAAGLYAARGLGTAGRAFGATHVDVGGVTLNWLTWSDHYFSSQLQKVRSQTSVGGRVQLITDDSDAYIKVKRGGGQWDISSEDALWVPKFYKEGLIVPFDIKAFPVSKQLYSVALNVPFWKAGSNQMRYPSAGRACRSTTTRSTSRRSRTRTTRCSTRSTGRRSSSRTSRPT
jgi:spermidine/putrescine-binding protein